MPTDDTRRTAQHHAQVSNLRGDAVIPGSSYPRVTPDGRTVWACCLSTVGGPCGHRTEPTPRTSGTDQQATTPDARS